MSDSSNGREDDVYPGPDTDRERTIDRTSKKQQQQQNFSILLIFLRFDKLNKKFLHYTLST